MNLKKIAFTIATSFLVLVGAVTFLPLRAIAGLESPCNYISDLVTTNPLSSDLASTGDDHMRCIKLALKTTFPNVNAAVTATDENLNLLTGLSGTVWTSANDGAASGLDADLLDGSSSAAFAQLGSANTFTQINELESAAPALQYDETDAASNERSWLTRLSGGTYAISTATDAAPQTAAVNAIVIDRNGTTVTSIDLQATAVQINSTSILSAAHDRVSRMTNTAGSADSCTTQSTANIGSCTRSSEGLYIIGFTTAYSTAPVCTATAESQSQAANATAATVTTQVTVNTRDSGGNALDQNFHVICMGQ